MSNIENIIFIMAGICAIFLLLFFNSFYLFKKYSGRKSDLKEKSWWKRNYIEHSWVLWIIMVIIIVSSIIYVGS